jgi:thiamine kinase-like enzyme
MGNWVLDGDGKLYLIDWEYSGMNEAMWDLSCLSIEADYGPAEDDMLLSAYYGYEGKEAGVEEKKRFIAAKMYVDFLWTLWGLTRVPFDGQFMQEYADNRYVRLKKNIDAYKKLG